jgi:hypothetical protein
VFEFSLSECSVSFVVSKGLVFGWSALQASACSAFSAVNKVFNEQATTDSNDFTAEGAENAEGTTKDSFNNEIHGRHGRGGG